MRCCQRRGKESKTFHVNVCERERERETGEVVYVSIAFFFSLRRRDRHSNSFEVERKEIRGRPMKIKRSGKEEEDDEAAAEGYRH